MLYVVAQPNPIYPWLLTNAVHYRLRLSWDRVLDPKAQHVQLDKRVRGAQANVDLSHILPSASALHSDASISAQDSDDDAQAVSKLFYLTSSHLLDNQESPEHVQVPICDLLQASTLIQGAALYAPFG